MSLTNTHDQMVMMVGGECEDAQASIHGAVVGVRCVGRTCGVGEPIGADGHGCDGAEVACPHTHRDMPTVSHQTRRRRQRCLDPAAVSLYS